MPEAQQVLEYLVTHYTVTDRVMRQTIEDATGLHGIPLSDALHELEVYGLIEETQRLYRVRPQAYVEAEESLDYSVRSDAVDVAHATIELQGDDENGTVDAKDLAEKLADLPVERLNIAAEWLYESGRIKLFHFIGTRPYAFGAAQAIYGTRKWLRDLGYAA